MTDSPEIVLPYPISTNRMWVVSFRSRRVVLSSEGRAWKAAAAVLARGQLGPAWRPLVGPVSIHVGVAPRKTKHGKESVVRIDLDNALKVAIDALQAVAYVDDRQIWHLVASVVEPRAGGALLVRVAASP